MESAAGTFARTLNRLAASQRALDLIRGGLALLLLWAAVSKLGNPTDFLGSLYAYELPLPRDFTKVVAVVLPWVELLCGLLLLGRVWAESALWLLGGLLIVFLTATGQAWGRGLQISCGCFDLALFGVDPAHPGWLKLVESPAFAFMRNLVLLAATGFLLRHARAPATAQPPQPPRTSPHSLRERPSREKAGQPRRNP